MEYRKEIEITDTGMVVARVFGGDRRCGLEFFTSIRSSNKVVEKKAKQAHKWADERIRICKLQECIEE